MDETRCLKLLGLGLGLRLGLMLGLELGLALGLALVLGLALGLAIRSGLGLLGTITLTQQVQCGLVLQRCRGRCSRERQRARL